MSTRPARHVKALKLLLAAVFAACLAAPGASAQAPPRYTVTDLGPFTPHGVNSVGQIAGNHSINNRAGVFIYDTRDGTFTLFPIGG